VSCSQCQALHHSLSACPYFAHHVVGTSRDDSLSSRFARSGLHFVYDVSHLESKIVVLENMLKGLSPQTP